MLIAVASAAWLDFYGYALAVRPSGPWSRIMLRLPLSGAATVRRAVRKVDAWILKYCSESAPTRKNVSQGSNPYLRLQY